MSSRNTIEAFLQDKNATIVTRQRDPGVYEGAFATVNRGALEWFGGPGIEGKWAKTTVQKITQEFVDMNTPIGDILTISDWLPNPLCGQWIKDHKAELSAKHSWCLIDRDVAIAFGLVPPRSPSPARAATPKSSKKRAALKPFIKEKKKCTTDQLKALDISHFLYEIRFKDGSNFQKVTIPDTDDVAWVSEADLKEAGKFDLVKTVYQRVINNSLLAANKKFKKADSESDDDDESSGDDDLDDSDDAGGSQQPQRRSARTPVPTKKF